MKNVREPQKAPDSRREAQERQRGMTFSPLCQLLLARSSGGLLRPTSRIDADYYNNPDNEGNIILALYNYGDREQHISPGDKVAQGVFVKYGVTADDVTVPKRERVGGVGSTGK